MITRVCATNYKSLRSVDLHLRRLSVLVGANGVGKSTVLDALRFVHDALDGDLDQAVRERGGFDALRRRSSGHPALVGLRLDLATEAFAASYRFALGPDERHGFEVVSERCEVQPLHDVTRARRFELAAGVVVEGEPELQAASPKRDLFLRSVSAQPPFDGVYRALRSIAVVNPNPTQLREYQKPDGRTFLARDASNLASIVRRLQAYHPERYERALRYLAAVVPGITAVEHYAAGPRETLRFRQTMDNDAAWTFYAPSMADGALRATALLIAAQQVGVLTLGVEEPEATLHPAAVRVVTDALVEVSRQTQVVLSTHAPDLLDHPGVGLDGVYVVGQRRGVSFVQPFPERLRGAVLDGGASVGDMLRAGQLLPEPAAPQARVAAPGLFGPPRT